MESATLPGPEDEDIFGVTNPQTTLRYLFEFMTFYKGVRPWGSQTSLLSA